MAYCVSFLNQHHTTTRPHFGPTHRPPRNIAKGRDQASEQCCNGWMEGNRAYYHHSHREQVLEGPWEPTPETSSVCYDGQSRAVLCVWLISKRRRNRRRAFSSNWPPCYRSYMLQMHPIAFSHRGTHSWGQKFRTVYQNVVTAYSRNEILKTQFFTSFWYVQDTIKRINRTRNC